MVKAAVRVPSGVPPFLFPFGLSARRRAERFGRWGHPESLLEQADWGRVAGAGVRAGGAKTGSRSRSLGRAAAGAAGVWGGGLFPRRQRQFRSGRAKKQATKRRTKKDFPSPERRRFVKTGFSARYKEAHRSGRPRGRKSPRPGKGDRRCRLSHFAVKKSGRRGRLSRFAVKKSGRRGRLSRFAAANSGRRGRLSRFAVKKSGRRGRLSRFAAANSGRRSRLSRFAVKKSSGRVGFRASPGKSPAAQSAFALRREEVQRTGRLCAPQGGSNLRERFLPDRGALSREFPTNRGPGGPTPKIAFSRPMGRLFCCEKLCSEAGGFP